jgi:L-asparagine oxygenase
MLVSAKSQLLSNGYAFLPDYLSTTSSTEVAHALGVPLTLGNGEAVHQLAIKETSDAPPNSYSGIYGMGKFPFHTDFAHWVHPPRFLFLRCLRGFEEVPTLLIDTFHLIDQVGKELLVRALVKPRRPVNHKLPLFRILKTNDDDPTLFRWDELFLEPAGVAGLQGIQAIKQNIHAVPTVAVALVGKGDTLIVDNWRMLHARSQIPFGCQSRLLERAYLGEIY